MRYTPRSVVTDKASIRRITMDILKQMLETLTSVALSVLGKLLFALIIFLIGRQLIKLVKRMFERSRAAKNLNESARGFISSAISITANLILVLTVVSVLGVPMTSIVALLGSAGLAIGLALQGGLSNFAGGVMILIFRPFDVGDYIVTDGVEGTVTKVSVFYTTLTTPDNRCIVVPNSTVSNSTITNVSTEDERRIDIAVSVPAGVDIDAVKKALTAAADGLNVSDREAPTAVLVGFGTGSYNFEMRAWSRNAEYWNVRFALLVNIPKKLEEAGIGIAKSAVVVTTKNK